MAAIGEAVAAALEAARSEPPRPPEPAAAVGGGAEAHAELSKHRTSSILGNGNKRNGPALSKVSAKNVIWYWTGGRLDHLYWKMNHLYLGMAHLFLEDDFFISDRF